MVKEILRYTTFALWFIVPTALIVRGELTSVLFYLIGTALGFTALWAMTESQKLGARPKDELATPKRNEVKFEDLGVPDELTEGFVNAMLRQMMGENEPHHVGFTEESITEHLEEFLREGRNHSEQSKDAAYALVHRAGCKNYNKADNMKCECKPIRVPFRDVERLGASVVAKKIYREMKPTEGEGKPPE